jgi:serine-type D-Ala-D-Ala carboxypeptidase/endopeptidase
VKASGRNPGYGGGRSPPDLLTYLAAQLHPEGLTGAARPLVTAIPLTHELRYPALQGMHIGFAWLQIDDPGTYWHNGGTGGYTTYVFFNPKEDIAGAVLVNTTLGRQGSLADTIGQHVAQCFEGRPAIQP